MAWLGGLDWRSGEWITPAIHAYAVVVLILGVLVFFIHRSRLLELSRRVGAIAGLVEGRPPQPVRLQQMAGMILYLGDQIERRADLDIGPVLDFVRQEERERGLGVARTLVHVTETMMELFPMLGIFGTVWGFAGVSQADFSSERLLVLFGTATGTTLWALFYVIIFRILYAALVQARVGMLEEYSERFQEFLSILEKRSSSRDFGMEAASDMWSKKTDGGARRPTAGA